MAEPLLEEQPVLPVQAARLALALPVVLLVERPLEAKLPPEALLPVALLPVALPPERVLLGPPE